jgi:hypothetical protein
MSHRGAMIFTTRRIHEALVLLLLVLAAPGRIAAMSVQAHTPGLSELRGPAAVGSSARAGAPGGPSTEESSAMSVHRLRGGGQSHGSLVVRPPTSPPKLLLEFAAGSQHDVRDPSVALQGKGLH